MKKYLSFLLALALLVSLPVLAFADASVECHNLGKSDECSDYSPEKHTVINRAGTIADYQEGAAVVYDARGNILTLKDEDGIVWEYQYSPYGNFMYRIGTIPDPEWTISEVKSFSNQFYSPTCEFEIPYENCVGFDLTFEITEKEFGNPDGNIAVYVYEPEVSGSRYQQEGTFRYESEEASYAVHFTEPETMCAVCLRPMNDGPLYYDACIGIFNVRIKSYDYK